jgi:ABC-type transport system substrate-binding protein
MPHRIKTLLTLIILFLFIYGCGTSDSVTVVPDAPRTGTADRDTTDVISDDFQQLRIGITEPVTNFDPLFADNLSTMRVLSLIYEGLYSLDRNGEPVPAIAREIEISEDGLEYLITINRDLYFHDSRVFTAGVGRRIHANDIKWAFERTARADVPKYASSLLMNVTGYRNYFLEQRQIYDRTKRVLDDVGGIEVIDPETISIRLNQADPDFLKKLASPYLFIYPQEAESRSDHGLFSNPVGTGLYEFRSGSDGTIVLILNSSENNNSRSVQPAINRIDFIYLSNESELFQKFNRNQIDWIPELGPQISRQVVSENGLLNASYREEFTLINQNTYRITSLFLNKNSTIQIEWLSDKLNQVESIDFDLNASFIFNPEGLIESVTANTEPDSEYFISFSDNPTTRFILSEINSEIIQPDARLAFFDIRITTPETSIYSALSDSFHYDFIRVSETPWLQINTPINALHKNYIDGIQPNMVPWKIFIEGVRVQDTELQSL